MFFRDKRGISDERGVTLIEILVVISIVMILTGIVFINYRTGERQLILQRVAFKLAQDIRRAQEMAMSAKECTHSVACPSGGIPSGGYGIYFDQTNPNQYIVYADTGSPWGRRNPSGGNEDIEAIFFETGVRIRSVSPPQASINFKPPDPTISLKDNSGVDSDNVVITIELTADTSKYKTIKVNKAGRIEVD